MIQKLLTHKMSMSNMCEVSTLLLWVCGH